MLTRRFFLSWIISSVVMFFLSYLWHGIILTDFARLSYPKGLFLTFAAVVYLIIGFVLAKAIDFKFLRNFLPLKPVLKGAIIGATCGMLLFIVATVIGVSFSTAPNMKNLITDVIWQFFEQTMGGIVVGITFVYAFDPEEIIEDF